MQIVFGIYYAVSKKLAKVLQKHFHPMINEWKESFLFHMVLHIGIIWNASEHNIQQRKIHASVNKFSPRSCWHAQKAIQTQFSVAKSDAPNWINDITFFPDQKNIKSQITKKKWHADQCSSKYCPYAGIRESDWKHIFTTKNKTKHKLQFLRLIHAASSELKRETDWSLSLYLIFIKTK